MTLSAALIPSGQQHAETSGTISVGAAFGEVAAAGANQLLRLPLPFPLDVITPAGFADQLYLTAKSLDGFVTDVRFDAVPVEYDNATAPSQAIARLRVDSSQLPAQVQMIFEAHHSIGR